jgi:hypothetical protein
MSASNLDGVLEPPSDTSETGAPGEVGICEKINTILNSRDPDSGIVRSLCGDRSLSFTDHRNTGPYKTLTISSKCRAGYFSLFPPSAPRSLESYTFLAQLTGDKSTPPLTVYDALFCQSPSGDLEPIVKQIPVPSFDWEKIIDVEYRMVLERH